MDVEKVVEITNRDVPLKKRLGFRQKAILFVTICCILILFAPFLLVSFLGSSFGKEVLLTPINKAIPGEIDWGKLSISLVKGRVVLSDFQISEVHDSSAIVHVDTVTIDISVDELFRKRIHVEELGVVHPRFALVVDTQGKLNIVSAFQSGEAAPKDTTEKKDSTSDPLPVFIDTAYIKDLAITYKTDSMSVDLQKLSFNTNGSVFPLNLKANLLADSLIYDSPQGNSTLTKARSFLQIDSKNVDSLFLALHTERDSLEVKGRVENYATDSISLDLFANAFIILETVESLLGKKISDGAVTLNAEIAGKINNPKASFTLGYEGTQILDNSLDSLHVPISLNNQTITIANASAVARTATIDLSSHIDLSKVFPKGFLDKDKAFDMLSYNGALTFQADSIPWASLPIRNSSFTLSLNGSGTAPQQIELASELTAKTTLVQQGKGVPLAVDGNISFNKGKVTIDSLIGTINSGITLVANGGLNPFKNVIDLNLEIDSLNLNTFAPFIPEKKVEGTVSADIHIKDSLKTPSLRGNIIAGDLLYEQFEIGDLVGDILLASDSGTVAVDLSTHGTIGKIDLAIQSDIFTPHSFALLKQPQFEVDISQLELNLSSLTGSAVQGELYAQGEYKGAIGDGDGSVLVSAKGVVHEQASIDSIGIDLAIKDSIVTITSVDLIPYDSVAIHGIGTYHLNNSYSFSITSDSVNLSSFITAVPKELETDLVLGATVSGVADSVDAKLSISFERMSWDSVALGSEYINIELADKNVTVAGSGIGEIKADYSITSGVYNASVVIDSLQLEPIFAIAKQKQLSGMVSGEITARGTNNLERADIAVSSLVIDQGNSSLISTDQVVLSITPEVIHVDTCHVVVGNAGKVDLSGTVRNGSELDLVSDIDIPIAIAERFTSELEQSNGSIQIQGEFKGTTKAPIILGSVGFTDVGLTVSSSQQRLNSLTGTILFTNDSIRVNELAASFDDGVVSADGAIHLANGAVKSGDFSMNIANLPIVVPDVADLRIGGDLYVSADSSYKGIAGTIELQECYYYQYIDPLPAPTASSPKRKKVDTNSSSSPLDNVDLQIAIVPRENLIVDNNLAFFDIKPDLMISGKASSPSVLGRMEVESGELNYLNRTFTVTKGLIDFVNPYKIAPEVEIKAETSIDKWDITMSVEGTVGEELRYNSESEPMLEENQILSLIVTGQLSDQFDSQQFLMSQLTAAALDKLNASMDLELSKDGLKIGEELNRRLYTEYTMKTENGEVNQIASLLVKIFDQLRLRGFAETSGNAGGEVQYNVEIR